MVPGNLIRALTRAMTAFWPLRSQKLWAALSSEERSMMSSDLRSAGESSVSPCDSRSNRSSAMNSFTTDAIGKDELVPPETSCPVSRSSTAVSMSAPEEAASAVAWRTRASSPSNDGAGWAGGGASGSAGSEAGGAWGSDCGVFSATGGAPCTWAHPVASIATQMIASPVIARFGSRRRIVLPRVNS